MIAAIVQLAKLIKIQVIKKRERPKPFPFFSTLFYVNLFLNPRFLFREISQLVLNIQKHTIVLILHLLPVLRRSQNHSSGVFYSAGSVSSHRC